MSVGTDKKTARLWVDIDVVADETIRGTLWPMRLFTLALPNKERTALNCLLETNARRATEQFHDQLSFERERPGNEGLSGDELLARSPTLRETYRRRREAEALWVVLCRGVEQNPPKRLKGAKPC